MVNLQVKRKKRRPSKLDKRRVLMKRKITQLEARQ